MKNKLTIASVAFVFLIGLCVLLYPMASDLISRWTSNVSIRSYVQQVAEMDDMERQSQLAEARAYNQALASGQTGGYALDGGGEESAFETSWMERVEMLREGAMIGYLKIPKINVYLPIRHGTSTEVLEEGVGHLDNTSLPVGGLATHAALSGHTGLPTSHLLTDLDQLEAGDVFYVYVLGETLAYLVDQIKVVEPTETDDLAVVPGEDYMTLVTCTPYGINSHRLLVRGRRTAYTETAEETLQRLSARKEALLIPGYVFSAIAGLLYLLGACVARMKRRG